MNIEIESIGTIHTEFTQIEGMPIQPTGAKGIKGTIEIKDKYVDGIKDLDDFSHIHILYLLHKVEEYPMQSIGVCCSHKVVAVGFNTLCYDAERRGIKPSARITGGRLPAGYRYTHGFRRHLF